MKKVLSVAAVALFVAGTMSSCKKDYTCSCSGDSWSLDIQYTKVKKKDAEESCSSAESTYKAGDATSTCTLK